MRASLRSGPISPVNGALILILAAFGGPLPAQAQVQEAVDMDFLEMDVATVGVDLNSGTPLALLHSDWNELLPIWIGEAEAGAIARELRGVETPRPMTHDLLVSVIEEMGGELLEIRVHDVRDNTYIGMLRIRTGEEGQEIVREVDSRPSDALALAVRTGATLQVNPELLTAAPDVNFISSQDDYPIVRIRGVTASDVSERYRERFSLPDRDGVVVLHATHEVGSRGIEQGDLIVEVNGTPVEDVIEFLEEVGETSESSHVPIKLLRDGEELEGELLPDTGPGRIGERR